jgi:hypothetical protein
MGSRWVQDEMGSWWVHDEIFGLVYMFISLDLYNKYNKVIVMSKSIMIQLDG